jgi:hypothetical protein
MNTVAKRKVEEIINREITQAVEAYKKRRAKELDALIEQYENQPSKDALTIQAKLKENEEEEKRLEKELEAVGFEINYRGELTLRDQTHWDDKYRHSWKEYLRAITGSKYEGLELYWSQVRSVCCPLKKLLTASTRIS